MTQNRGMRHPDLGWAGGNGEDLGFPPIAVRGACPAEDRAVFRLVGPLRSILEFESEEFRVFQLRPVLAGLHLCNNRSQRPAEDYFGRSTGRAGG